MYRLWPHKLRGEGHFAAVMRRAPGDAEDLPAAKGEKLPKIWQDFAKELGIQLPPGKAVSFGQSLYWAPEDLPELRGLKVERCGLELGVVKKDRFEPAHALALWLRDCANTAELSLEEAEVYMQGNVLPTKIKGWCLVTVGGYSLGWGKGDGKQLKNHYPKGLRRFG
jgi:NOL1/NOP2/fmu family ribosome biogenesis protein